MTDDGVSVRHSSFGLPPPPPVPRFDFHAYRAIVLARKIYRIAMRTFHWLQMLLSGPCGAQKWRSMRVPRRGCPASVFFAWGAADRACGKQKFTARIFSSGCVSFFLGATTGCGFISLHAQDSVVVHRVTPVHSPLLGPLGTHFSPSYSQCRPPPPSSCPPAAPKPPPQPFRPRAARQSV